MIKTNDGSTGGGRSGSTNSGKLLFSFNQLVNDIISKR